MATIPSSHIDTQLSQPAQRMAMASTPPFFPSKRPLSESDYYGESEATPIPKPRKMPRVYSRARFSSDTGSPTLDDPPSFTQLLQDCVREDSEDESDEVYDQFDLGDFTKEEIKVYESMLAPGERLRDAAPPEKSFAEMLEESYQTILGSCGQQINGPVSVRELPEELYELVRAGISNAIDRAISDNIIVECNQTVEYLKKVFMDEISGPSPRISHFIRNHGFPWSCPLRPRLRTEAQRSTGLLSGSPFSVQKQYEQYVYNFSRTLGLSMDDAERWVLKAREFWSEEKYDNTNIGEGEAVNSSNEMLDQPSNVPSPAIFNVPLVPVEHSDQAPGNNTLNKLQAHPSPQLSNKSASESAFKSKDAIEDNLQIMTINELKGAEQLQQPELPYVNSHCRSEEDKATWAMLRTSALTAGSFVDNGVSHDREVERTEPAVEGEKEKAAKRARKALKQAEKKATRQTEKRKRKKGEGEQINNPEMQINLTKTVEEASQFEPLENKDGSKQQKKKGRKRKEEFEVPSQSEVYFGEQHKHKKGRLESDAHNVNSGKSHTKKRGPQYSPFFKRSSLTEAEKDVNRKLIQLMDHVPSGFIPKKKDVAIDEAKMLGMSSSSRPPTADLPSTPVKSGVPAILASPSSDDSSPLSSLRSTPSLLSFDNEEIRRDNARIRQLSDGYARSKLGTPSRKLPDDPFGLPTPTSTPISLRELNKRILEGTIYQDGVDLVKPEALATLAIPNSKKARKRSVTVSRFFAKSVSKKPKASDKVSCIPFPPLHATSFGLVQERLCHDPFRLLIAVIFLNKTRGSVALPVFYQLMDRYPTPADLAAAKKEDVVEIIQHLGLQNQRAKKCINLAKTWLERPPEKGKRYRVLHYPKWDDGKDVRPDEIISEEDERVAWEIGQLPGIGVYAIDSWRIFCRDELLGLPSTLPRNPLSPESKEDELRKEWTRVLAGDKELRAYLRWRWLRNGWDWDPVTGERKKADAEDLAKADQGGIMYEGDRGDMVVGNAKGEAVLEAAKAESEVEGKDAGKQGDEDADDMITDTKTKSIESPAVGAHGEAQ